MPQLQALPKRPVTSLEISEENTKILANFHLQKPYENVAMEFSESKEFEEFLKEFMVNQETPLRSFKFQLADLKILQDSLKSRISLLQVRRICLDVSDTNQLAPIFQNLNSYTLKKVILRIVPDFDIDGVEFFENWKRSGLLILALKFENISLKNLESINNFLYYWSTFLHIDIFYNSFEYDPCKFFDVPFEKLSENSIRIELSPINRLAPSLVKLKLSNEISLKVLGNPLIMGRVIKYFKVFDIQNLRKTCNGIRSCVGHLKPDPQIGKYIIDMSQWKQLRKSIPYKEIKDSQNCASRMLADFETNLKNQKMCLEELKLFFKDSTGRPNETSEFLTSFREISIRRLEFLKVRKLEWYSVKGEDVMQVLPYLDPKHLENLNITNPYYGTSRLLKPKSIPFEIGLNAKTDQWQTLKIFYLRTEEILTPIQKMNLANFSNIFMSSVARITSEDIAYLKEKLFTPKLQRIIICFKEFVEDPPITVLLGQPGNTIRGERIWGFPIPGTNGRMMIIVLNERLCFENR